MQITSGGYALKTQNTSPLAGAGAPSLVSASSSLTISSSSKPLSLAEQIDKAFEALLEGQSPEDMLKEITSNGMNGMWSWEIKELKKKIAAQVMGEMGVTKESIAAMPTDQRIETELKIMQIVEERVREIVAGNINEDKKNPFSGMMDLTKSATEAMPGNIVDIKT